MLGSEGGLPSWLAAVPRLRPDEPTFLEVRLPLTRLATEIGILLGLTPAPSASSSSSSSPLSPAGSGALGASGSGGAAAPTSRPGRAGTGGTAAGAGSSSSGSSRGSASANAAGSGGNSGGNSSLIEALRVALSPDGGLMTGGGPGVAEGLPSISSPNLVDPPTVVWAGYVWALDVFVAR